MALVIRLRRQGSRKRPFYRIVVADCRSPRDGRFVEVVGTYDPKTDPPAINLKTEALNYWLSSGAKPSETVAKLIKKEQARASSASELKSHLTGAEDEGTSNVPGEAAGQQS